MTEGRGRHARPISQPHKQRSSGSCAIFVDTASGDADSFAVWTLNALPFRKKLHLSQKKKIKKNTGVPVLPKCQVPGARC